jgi:hypothetical protein
MGAVQVRSLDQPDETRSFPERRRRDGDDCRHDDRPGTLPAGLALGYVIQPGHDAWVVGDEPWVTVDFSQAMADYAKPS